MTTEEDRVNKELVIALDTEDQQLPRATQRWIAEQIAVEQMETENYKPSRPTHPHGSLVKTGVWSVRGLWTKEIE